MIDPTDPKSIAPGLAALSICESLLISMSDLKIASAKEISGILEDAATAHRNASESSSDQVLHLEVVSVIERIIAARNSIHKP